MKLSFSTKGWHDKDFWQFCDAALDLKLQGIELHNINNSLFTDENGAFGLRQTAQTMRTLYRNHLEIPCIDTISDLGDFSVDPDTQYGEIKRCIDIASRFRIANVRIYARSSDRSYDETFARVRQMIDRVLPLAEKEGVTLLVGSTGFFRSSEKLRDLLDSYASDSLGALWQTITTNLMGGESPEDVVKNLGAYIRHVHIIDGVCDGGEHPSYRLIGEGELPMDEIMSALRSVNYNGYISLVWDPAWCPEMADMELVLTHFQNYMKRFSDPSRKESSLYYNAAHTGRYVWKKDLLIDCTFPQVLDRMVEEFPDQYAFKYTTLDYTRTYSQFRDDVDTFSRSLLAMGVKPGSHVAVWASNVPQWYISFWAVTKIGAVLVSMNTSYKIHEAEYLLRQSDTHTLVMTQGSKDSDYASIIAELCPELKEKKNTDPLHAKRLPFLRNVVTVGFDLPGAMNWSEAIALSDRVPMEEVRRCAAAVDRDDVCNMQYTSGTTGFPKGVMLTHYNIVNNGKCIGDRMDLSTADRMMIQVPMFHCFGMVLAMTASMTHGTTLLPLPYFSPKSALACINSEHITAFHGVPTMFIAMLGHEDFPKTDFSYMRTGIMAGSPCPISVMRDVVDKMNMREITIVYGQTESSPGCTMSSTDDPIEVRVTTVGRPLPEVECRIVDPETGIDCPDEVTGEFVARGYNVMKGYYKMPKATASAIDKDGWLHTGDLACRTKEGNFRITGRLKDMIIRGGENIYPKEIEEFIYTHPKVSDVQVIGIPDEQYGEEVLACVILKEGETMTEDEMKTYIADHMARHKVPKYIDFVDAFPMNVAGKILKYKMREDAAVRHGLKKVDTIVTE